MNDEYF